MNNVVIIIEYLAFGLLIKLVILDITPLCGISLAFSHILLLWHTPLDPSYNTNINECYHSDNVFVLSSHPKVPEVELRSIFDEIILAHRFRPSCLCTDADFSITIQCITLGSGLGPSKLLSNKLVT